MFFPVKSLLRFERVTIFFQKRTVSGQALFRSKENEASKSKTKDGSEKYDNCVITGIRPQLKQMKKTNYISKRRA